MNAIEVVLTSFKMPFEKYGRILDIIIFYFLLLLCLNGVLIYFFSSMAINRLFIYNPFVFIFGLSIFYFMLLGLINTLIKIMFIHRTESFLLNSKKSFIWIFKNSLYKVPTIIGVDFILTSVLYFIFLLIGFFLLGGPILILIENMATILTPHIQNLGHLNTPSEVQLLFFTEILPVLQTFFGQVFGFILTINIISILITPFYLLIAPIVALENKDFIKAISKGVKKGVENYASLLIIVILTCVLNMVALFFALLGIFAIAALTFILFGIDLGLVIVLILTWVYLTTVNSVLSTIAYLAYNNINPSSIKNNKDVSIVSDNN